MVDFVDVVLLSFIDYATGETVRAVCHTWDLVKGWIILHLKDESRQRYYSIGKRFFYECVNVSKYTIFNSEYSEGMIKWDERNKIFEKYPKLKEKESC